MRKVRSLTGGGLEYSIDEFIYSLLEHIEALESKLDFSLIASYNKESQNFKSDFKRLSALLASLPTPPQNGWERVRISQVAKVESGGTPSKKISEYWNGDINWIRSEVCQNCYIYESQVKEKITELGLKNSSAKIFKSNSVLIALVGATIGKVGFLTFESSTNQNIAGLYPLNLQVLNPKFLYFACLELYPRFRELGDFTMANLTFIRTLQIPLPPLEIQEQILSIIEKIEENIALISQNMDSLNVTKTKVLKRLLET